MKTYNFFKWKMITTGLCILGVIIAIIGVEISKTQSPITNPVMWIGIAVCILGIVLDIIKLRCPHCGKYAGYVKFWHDYCPRCGGDLNE